jgi:hypothetical protein
MPPKPVEVVLGAVFVPNRPLLSLVGGMGELEVLLLVGFAFVDERTDGDGDGDGTGATCADVLAGFEEVDFGFSEGTVAGLRNS